jgi:outer membrane protein TolC
MINLPLKKLTACLFFMASASQAQVLQGTLTELLKSSPRVTAAQSDEQASGARAKETFRRAWTPQFDVTVDTGEQRYETINQVTTNQSTNRANLSVTQLVYDFGRSNSLVAESDAVVLQTRATGTATVEGLLLDAITAQWSVVRSQQVLDFARQSEASVLKQTKLENSMVELGKGYESNVLQAKIQLATAEARRIRAEGALQIAQARVSAVFGALAPKVNYQEVAFPFAKMVPATLEEAHAIALANNQQIQIGAHRSEALRQRIDSVRAKEFLPRLQLVGEAGRRENIDGQSGVVNDRKLMLQLQYNLNGGLAGQSAVTAAVKELAASQAREDDARALVLEQVSIAWRNLMVARSNRTILSNQVNIASKFLEMASAERQLGRRSLLDILTAEMSLINAQSDLTTTEADLAIAGLTVLQGIGRLNMNNLTISKLDAKP